VVKQRETQISTFINRVVWATQQQMPGLGAAKAPLARAQRMVKGGSWKRCGAYGRRSNSVKASLP